MAAIDPGGEEKFYIDGVTFEGIRNQVIDPDGEITFLQGKSDESLFPLNNQDTGKFFSLFE